MKTRYMRSVVMYGVFAIMLAVLLGSSVATETHEDGNIPPAKKQYGDQQPLFDRINLREGWEITQGDPKILVGVIDNGFDFFHPDLKGNLIPGYYYPGGFHTEFYASGAHGTLVSSIIVAKDDGVGMAGLAPRCKVLCASQGMLEHTLVKMRQEFFRDNAQATLADWQAEIGKRQDVLETFGREWTHYQLLGAADAIEYLVDHGARIINFSGGMERSLCPSDELWEKVEAAFAYAAEKDVVIVLAAGNNAAKWEGYPGKADSMLVVGASLLNDTRWEQDLDVGGMKIKQGSNYGQRLSVMAPVENLLVCQPHEKRWYDVKDSPMGPMKLEFTGPHQIMPMGATSAAAPIVSSLAALVLSVNPDLDAKSVVQIIQQGCDDLAEPGYDIYTGHGRVNFGKTLAIAQNWNQR